MLNSYKEILVNKEINLLREKLNKLLFVEPMSSKRVMELSKKLDILIARLYNLKNECDY